MILPNCLTARGMNTRWVSIIYLIESPGNLMSHKNDVIFYIMNQKNYYKLAQLLNNKADFNPLNDTYN